MFSSFISKLDTLMLRRKLPGEFQCTWGVSRATEHVFVDYFGVPRHADAQETISL